MKKGFFLCLLFIINFLNVQDSVYSWPAYTLLYKEQLYKLYHQYLYMYPEHYAENIHWLETILRSDFANPLYALAKIETKQEWEWYRNLFSMHVKLLLIQNYLQWAKRYVKDKAYFYNAPWRDMNLKSLEKSTALIDMAELYWKFVLQHVQDIKNMNLYFLNLEEIQYWEDEYYRISNNTLDYEKIINKERNRINSIKIAFENMDKSTY